MLWKAASPVTRTLMRSGGRQFSPGEVQLPNYEQGFAIGALTGLHTASVVVSAATTYSRLVPGPRMQCRGISATVLHPRQLPWLLHAQLHAGDRQRGVCAY